MRDEITPDSTRREGVAALPVRLADGACWGLARPTLRLKPKLVAEPDPWGRSVDRITVEAERGYPSAVRSLIRDLRSACEAGSAEGRYRAFLALAVCLLRRAHDVSPEAARQLLDVPKSELPRLVREVAGLVSGAGRAPDAIPVERSKRESS